MRLQSKARFDTCLWAWNRLPSVTHATNRDRGSKSSAGEKTGNGVFHQENNQANEQLQLESKYKQKKGDQRSTGRQSGKKGRRRRRSQRSINDQRKEHALTSKENIP